MYRRLRRRTGPPAATGAAPQPTVDDADGRDGGDGGFSESTGSPTLAVTIAATSAELSGLRSAVAEFTRNNGGGDDVAEDLELIVSELATNVVRHTSDTDITVTLRADDIDQPAVGSGSPVSTDRRWTLHMTGARDIPEIDDVDTPPVDQEGGRGLLIVRAVADDVHFDRAGGTVKCTLTA